MTKSVVGRAGWGFAKSGVKKREQDGTLSYSIPYSEHSSWVELRECVKAFRPKKLIPTVNVTDSASFDRMIAKFADLMDLSESRKHIDRFFVAKPGITQDASISGVKTCSPRGRNASSKRSIGSLDAENSQVSLDDREVIVVDEVPCLKAWRSDEGVVGHVVCEDCSQTVADDVCDIFDM